MNWSALYGVAPFLLVVAVIWTVTVWRMTKLEPPVEAVEFGAVCRCGHVFGQHSSEPHGTGSPCAGQIDWETCTVGCKCSAFEPEERPTEPATPFTTLRTWDAQREHEERIASDLAWDSATELPAPRTLMVPPGFDVVLTHEPDTDRLALVPPACAHRAYSVDTVGDGSPLRCLNCGEELAE